MFSPFLLPYHKGKQFFISPRRVANNLQAFIYWRLMLKYFSFFF